ncbi:MAG: M14 family zinc carboxypeptidase, partial [Actinomycetota bacterium]
MARRQRDPIDPTARHPFGRRRFLQGAAATTAAAFPILRASSARAGGGCDLYDTPPSFMGIVPDPESVLGFPIGIDEEVSAADSNTYLQAVAAASDRVREELVGQSVDGRPIRYAVVGHPGNITVGGIEAIRQANLEIRDPETRQGRADELARTTPAFAWMTGNVHGSEESGADAALQLLYELADRDDCVVERILDELVIFVIPVQNPDGRVLDQRRNAYGFDLNRDFFARAQVETDDRVELM